MAQTKIADLINPEVMADMISAKVPKKLAVLPFAKIDTTLTGKPGDTITVPQYAYIGDAADVAEGVEAETVKLTAGTTTVTVKKAMKAVTLTDEAVLSGYGDPVGETNNQLSKSIASKEDNDGIDALMGAQLAYDGSASVIKYAGVVDAVDLFEEEVNSDKVLFVHPKQVTQLRKDSDFVSADKYTGDVVMTGEIGKIANCRVVPSKKVPAFDTFYKFDSSGALSVVASGGNDTSTVDLSKVLPTLPTAKVDDKVTLVSVASYFCPIVKLNNDAESEEDAPALTIYMKRDVNVETERHTLSRTTDISADMIYAAALSNTSKVVLARFKQK